MPVSNRCKHVWKRLTGFYGSRFVEQYGPQPSVDWQKVIDRADRQKLSVAMERCRREYPHHPPTLGEFESLIRRRTDTYRKPSDADRLAAAMSRRPLSRRQMTDARLRWFLHDPNGAIVGYEVATDGDNPGHRIMIDDLALEADAA